MNENQKKGLRENKRWAVNRFDFIYHDLLNKIMDQGEDRGDRTGTGTRSIFGWQGRFNIQNSFPLITTKRVWFKGIVHELLWFLQGNKSIDYLHENKVHIWDEWVKEDGTFGPIYGSQWRNWNDDGVDQIKNVIQNIREKPQSRRHIVSAWNPGKLDEMALPPCHILFQFYVRDGRYLDCQLYQRSADCFLGAPFNIASYSLLTYIVAGLTELIPGEFVYTIGDAHIYQNHFDQVNEQLSRDSYPPPILELYEQTSEGCYLGFDVEDIDDIDYNCIHLFNYRHQPAIKAPIAV